MLSFRKGWQSFKEGLDRGQIIAYWSAVWGHAWEILWGAGVIGLICTVLTFYYAPSRWILGWVVAWVFLVAGYYAWRAEHIRLETKIDIARLRTQEWTFEQGTQHAGHHARAYYFEVVNSGEGVTIENVSVKLTNMSPEVPNLDWLPVPLHLKHDNREKAEDYVQSFSLNPRESKNIDFVDAIEGNNRFGICHIVPGVNKEVPFDTDGHRLQVMVTAKNMPMLSVWFRVWRDEAGLIQCKMEK